MNSSPRVRVAAVLVRDGALLLVRHLKDDQTYWLLPGGGVDYGERLDEALVREVLEETGLTIRVDRVLFLSDSIPADRHRHMIQVTFSAEIVGGKVVLGNDPRVVECKFVNFSELSSITLYPNMKDALMEWVDHDVGASAPYLGNLWES